jgi:hypothetical protein
MKLFQKLGFTKADELDQHIALCSVRLSWLTVMLALFIWSVYDVIMTHTITMPLTVFFLGIISFFSTDLYLRRDLSSDRQE